MADRLTLQSKLEGLLGSRNVYYDPPENLAMEYDAIKYSKKPSRGRFADDARYSKLNCYELIVIARKSDHPVIEKLLDLPYCSHDRHYKADNLAHDIFTLYY